MNKKVISKNNPKIIIYTGLSISHDKAKVILDADYRNPVKRGDISKVINENPDIIGIIDGVFHQSPAVSHKEIMNALKKGITVIGASSMGALRASELNSLGMIGIGYVYEKYSSGEIESDDDVAVAFIETNNWRNNNNNNNEDTNNNNSYNNSKSLLEQISEPLVNIKYSTSQAVDKKIISEDERKEIVNIAKNTHYTKRNYPKIIKQAHINKESKENFKEFINNKEIKELMNIKKQDAIALINYIKTII